MLSVRAERLSAIPSHLTAAPRRPDLAERARPPHRALRGSVRPMAIDAIFGAGTPASPFEAAAPRRS